MKTYRKHNAGEVNDFRNSRRSAAPQNINSMWLAMSAAGLFEDGRLEQVVRDPLTTQKSMEQVKHDQQQRHEVALNLIEK